MSKPSDRVRGWARRPLVRQRVMYESGICNAPERVDAFQEGAGHAVDLVIQISVQFVGEDARGDWHSGDAGETGGEGDCAARHEWVRLTGCPACSCVANCAPPVAIYQQPGIIPAMAWILHPEHAGYSLFGYPCHYDQLARFPPPRR